MPIPARTAVLLTATVVAVALGVSSGRAANPVFQVTYGSGTIVVSANGTPVGVAGAPSAVIAPGAYDLTVLDTGGVPAFQLSGPGVNVLATQSPTVVTVTFQPNSTYFFQDANDENSTYRTFVTSGPPTGPAAAPPKGGAVSNSDIVGSAPTGSLAGTLDGALTKAGSISLTARGKPVSKLAAGRYRVVVTDSSPKAGLTLREVGGRSMTVTTAAFVGKHSLTLALGAGRWTLSVPGESKTFVVARA